MKINILGVPFDELNMAEAVDKVMDFMAEDKFRMICTPNPEIVMNARADGGFMKLLNSADMVVADGVGVVWASKYFGKQLEERVSGYDLAQGIFEKMKDTEYTAYFFGGKPGVAEKAKQEISQRDAIIESAKRQYNELMDTATKYRDEAIKWRGKFLGN